MEPGRPDARELRAFYERYIEAFNAHDEDAFVGCFHLPVSVLRLPADGADPGGSSAVTITDADALWPMLPATWTRSTIDDVRIVGDGSAFAPRPGLVEHVLRRPALQVTVTRWADDVAYEQVHVLYLLTIEAGRLGIKAMVPLAVARRPAPR